MTDQPIVDGAVRETCFVIMPIADRAGYPAGHFAKVYALIIEPAIIDAGYIPFLASKSSEAVVIHLEILNSLLKAPMALCDISDLNANVMFELGIRQAFDKPVVIVKDERTHSPFDLIPIRYQDYNSGLFYESVMNERHKITAAIKATAQGTGDSVNSLVSLLGMQAAAVKGTEQNPTTAKLEIIERNLTSLTRAVSALSDKTEKNEVSRYFVSDPAPVKNLGMYYTGLTAPVLSPTELLWQPTEKPTDFTTGLMARPSDAMKTK